jgi:hypothetical protein
VPVVVVAAAAAAAAAATTPCLVDHLEYHQSTATDAAAALIHVLQMPKISWKGLAGRSN